MPIEGEVIGQVRNSRGNNLHEIEDEFGNVYVASMPSKFRKAVWIKRGQFVVLKPIEEGDKVKAEIEHILDDENVLHIRESKKWPERFESQAEALTREAKRGGAKEGGHPMIDDDMLPPSESDDENDDARDSEGSDGESFEDSEKEVESDGVEPQIQNTADPVK
ncbi:hypothetical protein WR25_11998 [Diploscapter pachys]|uniref:Probable RNA-binding protein EIF1AD n=1 Tax=Diploscapter pachys TaxID=2018661 RepID=A0A2A2K6K7_9BILA|nr:hypothetical protein WR25_11998 [Diploscapter pachys]